MKFFLINPDYMGYGDPPLGLAYLAAYIRKNDSSINIKILDQIKKDKILKSLKEEQPDIIGISSVSSNYWKVKELGKEIKKLLPSSILVIGGVHITISPESFNDSPFDVGVRGEGEITSLALVKNFQENGNINIKKLSKIPGFLLRDGKKIINSGLHHLIEDLDEIPMPARDLLNMRYYTLPRFSAEEDIEPIGTLLTSRGCPYACKFCSSSSFWNRRLRFFSAERVVSEIELLYKKYNYKHLYIYDDLFFVNKERLMEIFRGLKKKKLIGKVRFSVYGRANCFDDETATLLKKMNVKRITFGFETGSQKILTYLKGKGITIEQGVKAIKIAKKHGLKPGGFFMLGSPTETVEDMEKTYQFIKNYCRENFIVYQTIPFPKTEIWSYAIENNILPEDFYEKEQKEFIDINTDMLLSKEISKDIFKEYFAKIKGLEIGKKKQFISKLFLLRPRHIKAMLSREFLNKAFNLRHALIKRISTYTPYLEK